MRKSVLILCLGNEIVGDDGFGLVVAQRLDSQNGLGNRVDIVFAPIAGFALLDYLADREKALIVDTICTGKNHPGAIRFFSVSEFTPTNHLYASHQINLPTALELGKQLGVNMPRQVDILAVEAKNIDTFMEELSPPLKDAVDDAVSIIIDWIQHNSIEELEYEDRKR